MKLRGLSVKLQRIVFIVMLISSISTFLVDKPSMLYSFFSMTGIALFLYLVLMELWQEFIHIPLKSKGGKSGFEYLESDFKKMNIFNMSNELAKVVNYFNSDSMKCKIYSNEISNDEYQLLFTDALRKCIELNLNTQDKN